MLIRGQCHCGNVGFVLDWQPEPESIAARACDCTFCTRHGGVWTACPTGSLRIAVREPALVSRYRFGTETADFHVCARCGVPPVVTSEIEGRTYAVVNVNTFDNVPAEMLRRASSNFDGEDEASRLARRQKNWIGDVMFEEAR